MQVRPGIMVIIHEDMSTPSMIKATPGRLNRSHVSRTMITLYSVPMKPRMWMAASVEDAIEAPRLVIWGPCNLCGYCKHVKTELYDCYFNVLNRSLGFLVHGVDVVVELGLQNASGYTKQE